MAIVAGPVRVGLEKALNALAPHNVRPTFHRAMMASIVCESHAREAELMWLVDVAGPVKLGLRLIIDATGNPFVLLVIPLSTNTVCLTRHP